MQFSTFLVASLAALLASAQDASDLPTCSLPCFVQNIGVTGCGLFDYACQCTTAHQNQLRPLITSCVLQACPQAEQLTTLQVTNEICAKYGGDGSGSNPASPGASPTATTSQAPFVPNRVISTFTGLAQPAATAAVGGLMGGLGALALGLAL